MTILVTGASGFLGSSVVRQLLENGENIRVLTRQNSGSANLAGLKVDVVTGDLRDRQSLIRACSNVHGIYHVAADYRLWVKNSQSLYDSNVQGTINLMQSALDANVEKIVYTSSVATLGTETDGQSADETTPVEYADMIGDYKKSKFLAERAVDNLVATEGLPAVIVNPSTPVGPRDIKPTPTGRVLRDAALGKIPAYVNTGLNVVHVDDVATGHILAFEKGQIEGNIKINFDNTGRVKDDYKIEGSIYNFNAKILKKFNVNQTDARFKLFKNHYSVYLVKGNINDIDLANSEFEINQENKNFNVNGNLVSRANLKNIQNTLDLFQINLLQGKVDKSEISFDLKSSISFQLEKYIKVKNLKINGDGKIHYLNIQHKINTSKLKEMFTNYNDSFQITDTEIKFSSDSNKQDFELKGLINLTNEYENFQSKLIFDKKKNNTNFDVNININSSIIKFPNLNYKKEINDKASIKFKGNRKKNKGYNFEVIEFKESNNLILIKDIELNEKNQVNDLKELIVRTARDNTVNNDFKLTKNKKIKIQGEIYDARPLLISINKEDKNIRTRSNFAIFETLVGQDTHVLCTGEYRDKIVRENGALKFQERICIYDTTIIPNSIVRPI